MKIRLLVLLGLPLALVAPATVMAQAMGDGMARGEMATRPLMAPELPAGTVTVRVGRGSLSNNAVDVEVEAQVVGTDRKARQVTAKTGPDGRATFKGLPPGAHFQAHVTLDGQRLETADFAIPQEGGARLILVSTGEAAEGEQAMPPGHEELMEAMRGRDAPSPLPKERTSDASVLRAGPHSRIVLDLREDALVVMEELVMENTADKVFQPGPAGVRLPLADGSRDAESIPGGVPIKIADGAASITGSIPPLSSGMPARVRFGFLVSTHDRDEIGIRQPMPWGMPDAVVMVPESTRLTVQGPGVRELPSQSNDSRETIRVFQLPSIAPAGILHLTVGGIPVRGHTGETVAGVLFLGMVLAGAIGVSRGRKPAAPPDTRDRLLAELAEWERTRRAGGEAPEGRRKELIAALRQTYRQVR